MTSRRAIAAIFVWAVSCLAGPLDAAEPPTLLRSVDWEDGVRVDVVRGPFVPFEAVSPIFWKLPGVGVPRGGFTLGVTLTPPGGDQPVTIAAFFVPVEEASHTEQYRVAAIKPVTRRVVFVLAGPYERIIVCEAGLAPAKTFYLKRIDWSDWAGTVMPPTLPPERVSTRIEVDPKDESTTVEVIDAYDPKRVGHALFRRGRDDAGYTLVKRWHVPE